jgi:hypothetical protein
VKLGGVSLKFHNIQNPIQYEIEFKLFSVCEAYPLGVSHKIPNPIVLSKLSSLFCIYEVTQQDVHYST